jgi:hypothetical protein
MTKMAWEAALRRREAVAREAEAAREAVEREAVTAREAVEREAVTAREAEAALREAALRRREAEAVAELRLREADAALWRLKRVAREAVAREEVAAREAEAALQPPRNLELLLYLFNCEPLVGDLEERYRKLVKRLGQRRADLWYTKQVLTSIWPLLRAGLRRMGSSAAVGAIAFVLRLFGMGRIADELKQVVRRRKHE